MGGVCEFALGQRAATGGDSCCHFAGRWAEFSGRHALEANAHRCGFSAFLGGNGTGQHATSVALVVTACAVGTFVSIFQLA